MVGAPEGEKIEVCQTWAAGKVQMPADASSLNVASVRSEAVVLALLRLVALAGPRLGKGGGRFICAIVAAPPG